MVGIRVPDDPGVCHRPAASPGQQDVPGRMGKSRSHDLGVMGRSAQHPEELRHLFLGDAVQAAGASGSERHLGAPASPPPPMTRRTAAAGQPSPIAHTSWDGRRVSIRSPPSMAGSENASQALFCKGKSCANLTIASNISASARRYDIIRDH